MRSPDRRSAYPDASTTPPAGPSPAVCRIMADDVRSALGLAAHGRVYDLATALSRDMPQGPSATFGGFRISPFRTPRALTSPEDPPPFDYSMEVVTGSLHLGTHLDGLAHIHAAGRMFGGIPTGAAYSDFGWKANGVETVPPIVGRGVLFDVPAAFGTDPLPDGFEVTEEHLRVTAELQGIEVRANDIVLVRTGKIAQFKDNREEFFGPQPGVGAAAAIWLYESGMVVLGTDTSGTEPHPIVDLSNTTHQAMLVERGVLLLEILDLDGLARDGVYEFAFVCLPLKIVGATGSWARPIAIS